MKNKNLNYEEKCQIVKNLEKFYVEEEVLNNAFWLPAGLICGVGAIICLVIGLVHDPLAFKGLSVALSAGVLSVAAGEIAKAIQFRKMITKKFSYFKLRKLEKSGEIAKWRKEYLEKQNNMEITEYQSTNEPTTPLNNENVTYYQPTNSKNSKDLEK